MTNKNKIICVFGGTGFLGRYIVQDLARCGYRIKIATRYPESAYALKTYGDIGQIVPVACDYKDEASVSDIVVGCDGVINLVGILYQKGKNSFTRAHRDLAENIAKACTAHKVRKFIHVSALGVEKSQSNYAASKLAGEEAVMAAYPKATILRPSVVFGPGDNFFNMFAKLAAFLPILPLIGGGKTRFQPVYVGDIAEAVTNIMTETSDKFDGQNYQLGGPEIVSFKEIYQILLAETNRHCALIPLPWGIAKIQGAVFGLLPKPLLTYDQVISLKTDNIVSEKAQNLGDLGVNATAMGTILPLYLSNFKKGGKFGDKSSQFSS